MLEAGVIDIGGTLYYIGEDSPNEFELYKSDKIFYEEYLPRPDEKTRRLNDINLILRILPAPHRRLIVIGRQ